MSGRNRYQFPFEGLAGFVIKKFGWQTAIVVAIVLFVWAYSQ